jgi:geranylgeranylglycerol-phosphate geranylgeranyltransferase
LNGLMGAAGVLVGAFVSRSPTRWGAATIGGLSAFAAAGAANAFNDRMDVAADRVNRPDRPLPSGRATSGAAVAVSIGCGVLSLLLAALISPRAFLLALAWLALTALYSVALKGIPLAGNIAVALVASTPFLMGGFTQGKYLLALVPSGLAFLMHLAREIAKDVEDMEGDRVAGVLTFAVRRGAGASYGLVRALLLLLMALAVLPFALRIYGWGYAVVIVLVDVALIRLMVTMGREAGRSAAPGPATVLKWVMALGLVAFVLGVI